jgi:hypothetical protein
VDRGHGTVALREQVHEIDARGELEVGELDHLVDLEARDVDLDELRQVLRQAAHLDVVAHVPEHAALLLDALRLGAAPEVERNVHLDLLVLQHALEVDVHDLVLVRVALHVLEDCGLLLFADLEREDGREEALVVHQLRELRVVDDEGARVALAPVEDRRELSRGDAGGGSHPCPGRPGTRRRVRRKSSCHVSSVNPRTAN